MTYLLKIKAPDEASWLALYRSHLADEVDGEWRPKPGVSNIVLLGPFLHKTGRMIEVDGPGGSKIMSPEMVVPANPGYHVDLTSTFVPAEVQPYLQNPAEPRHVYAGNHVLAMPEVLPEAEETLMVTRGIGAQVPDDQLSRIELQLLRGKITPDMAADRKAWVKAGIAITESRAALAEARQAREKAVEDARTAAAERTRLLALREAEMAKRQTAVDALVGKVGAARTPFIAARDAATAMASTLADSASAQASAQAVAIAARDAAAAVLANEATKIKAARATRDTLKAAIK